MGGVLSASVGYDMGKGVTSPGAGLERFLSGAVGFPLSIILIASTCTSYPKHNQFVLYTLNTLLYLKTFL